MHGSCGCPNRVRRTAEGISSLQSGTEKYRLSGRDARVDRRGHLVCVEQRRPEPRPRQHDGRFRLPEQPRRLRPRADADRLFQRLDLFPRAAGRPHQHARHRRRRHRHRDDRRPARRHRAAVAQLAGRAAVHRLCGNLPQHPAPAGHLLLVSRRPRPPAVDPHHLPAPRRKSGCGLLRLESRHLHAGAGLRRRVRERGDRLCDRRRGGHRLHDLGECPPERRRCCGSISA